MSYNPIGQQEKAKSVSVVLASDALAKEITPAAQATVSNVYADVVGSEIDSLYFKSISYTLINATETITYQILGDNRADYATAVVIQTADILAAGVATYAVAQAPYRYYKVQIKDKVNGVHGTTGVYGLAKA